MCIFILNSLLYYNIHKRLVTTNWTTTTANSSHEGPGTAEGMCHLPTVQFGCGNRGFLSSSHLHCNTYICFWAAKKGQAADTHSQTPIQARGFGVNGKGSFHFTSPSKAFLKYRLDTTESVKSPLSLKNQAIVNTSKKITGWQVQVFE